MALRPFRVLSLFAGAAGVERGISVVVPGARSVCFVEREAYAAAVLVSRMEEGALAPAPIWSDVSTFDGRPWRGVVDCVAGGFPCQDISNAGKREGIEGERSGLWSEFARVIREVGPRFVFVENVSALAIRGLDRVLGDLAGLGFDAEWDCFRADQVGAPHRRERIFILAYAGSDALRELAEREQLGQAERGHAVAGEHGEDDVGNADGPGRVGSGGEGRLRRTAIPGAGTVGVGQADADSWRCGGERLAESGGVEGPCGRQPDGCGSDREFVDAAPVADADDGGRRQGRGPVQGSEPDSTWRSEDLADAESNGRDEGRAESGHEQRGSFDIAGHIFPPGPDRISEWQGPAPAVPRSESAFRRGADGVAAELDGHLSCLRWRADRLRLCGNGVVPQQAALAFATLWGRAVKAALADRATEAA